MDNQPETNLPDLCGAIEAALRLAESADNTLVSALLSEAHEAASCDEKAVQAQ